jgi:hypothetical protein
MFARLSVRMFAAVSSMDSLALNRLSLLSMVFPDIARADRLKALLINSSEVGTVWIFSKIIMFYPLRAQLSYINLIIYEEFKQNK